jgi:hypothetical protein
MDMDTDLSGIDDVPQRPRLFLVPVEATLKALLASEDTDKNMQITIDDAGPKVRLPYGIEGVLEVLTAPR